MARAFLKDIPIRKDRRQDPGERRRRGFLPFEDLTFLEEPELPAVSADVTAPYTPEPDTFEIARKSRKLLIGELVERMRQKPKALVSTWGVPLEEFAKFDTTAEEINKYLKPYEYLWQDPETGRVAVRGSDPYAGLGPYEAFEKKTIETVNQPLFNVGGVEISISDIAGLGLIGYGGYQVLAQGIPAAYQALVRGAVTRNVDKLSKETGINLEKETKSNFVNALSQKLTQTQKPAWLTKQSIKEIFKPSGKVKGTFTVANEYQAKAEETFAPLVRQTIRNLPKLTATRTGVPGMTMTQAEIQRAIQGITPATAEAMQAGRAELSEGFKPIEFNKSGTQATKVQMPDGNVASLEKNRWVAKVADVEYAGLTPESLYQIIQSKTPSVPTPKTPPVAPESKIEPVTAFGKEIVPEAIPPAEPLYGETEVAIQASMIPEAVPAREVRTIGKGVPTQISMDEQAKLAKVKADNKIAVYDRRINQIRGILETKGRTPQGEKTKAELRLEIAELEAKSFKLEFDTEDIRYEVEQAVNEIRERSSPYGGNRGFKRKVKFQNMTSKQLDVYVKELERGLAEKPFVPAEITSPVMGARPPVESPTGPPPVEPPIETGEGAISEPAEPSLNQMNKIIERATATVKHDRPGIFNKIIQHIPGLKQIKEFERPGLKMTGKYEKILIAHVAESQARCDVSARSAGSRAVLERRIKDIFGRKALLGEKTNIKFVGTSEEAKNPITGTLKDIFENPELYELSREQSVLIADLESRNTDLLKHVVDGYGAEIGQFPAKPDGAFLANVDISEEAIDVIGSQMRAIASGRQKERFYPTARERMKEDPTFKPEVNIDRLLYGMDGAKARAASGQTFREVLGGKTREEAMQETHPELYEKMQALKKKLASLRGSAGRLNEKLDKAIFNFMTSELEEIDLLELQSSLDVRLASGPRKGMSPTTIQREVDKTREDIKALKPAWTTANLKPYKFIQQGIYRYYPADEIALISELLEKSNNPFLNTIENIRGTAFSGDLSPIVGVQTPLGILADPIGSFMQAGGGLVKAFKTGNPFVSFSVNQLSEDIAKDTEEWSQFFSLLGRKPAGTPQEFAGGFLAKIPGFSAFTEATFVLVTRQAYGLYNRTWTQLAKFGVPELQAKISAVTTASRVFPFLSPTRLGQSSAREKLIRAMPTSYSFIRKPAEMMGDAALALGKIATFQRPTATQFNSLKFLLTIGASAMVVSALSQALDAHRKDENVIEAVMDAINPDPKNGKFLSIVYGNYRIPIGGPYRALFRAIYPQEVEGLPVPLPFVGLYNYLVNRVNPAMRAQVDLLQNKDYYGAKIRSGDVPNQIIQTMLYEIESFLPLTAGAAMEAQRTGLPQEDMITQVVGQFAGVNIIENEMYEVNALRDKYSMQEYGKEYEELNQGERDELSRKYKDLAQMEEEAKESFRIRGEDLPKVYSYLTEQAISYRNDRLNNIAQNLIDGNITKEQYDNERGYIRPYYSGQRNAIWQFREQLDPQQVKQIEEYYAESSKNEDKALNAYWEYYNILVESTPLPKDWDMINAQLEAYLAQYEQKIQDYINKRKNDWILDLPEPARTVELQRLQGIEDGSWWDDYRGSQGVRIKELPKEKKTQSFQEYLEEESRGTSKSYTPGSKFREFVDSLNK